MENPLELDRWCLAWPEAVDDAPPPISSLGDHAARRYRHFRRFIETLDTSKTDNVLFGFLLNAGSLRDEMRAFEDEASLPVRLAKTGHFVRQLRRLHGVLDAVAAAYEMDESSVLREWGAALAKEREGRVKWYRDFLGSKGGSEDFMKTFAEVESGGDKAEEIMTLLKGAVDKYGPSELTEEEIDVTQKAFGIVAQLSGIVVLSLPTWFSLPFEYSSVYGLSRWGNDCFYPEHSDRERFVKEASTWSELNHPHVAKFLGACHVGDRPFIAHEKVRTLVAYVADTYRSERKVWHRMYEVSLALQYMHERGFVCQVSADRIHCAQYEDRAVLLGANAWRENTVPSVVDKQGEQQRRLTEEALAFSVIDVFSKWETMRTSKQASTHSTSGVWPSECPAYLNDNEWAFLNNLRAPSDGGINHIVELLAEFAGIIEHNDWAEYIPMLERQIAQSVSDIELDKLEVTLSGETIRELFAQCRVSGPSTDTLFDQLLIRTNNICDQLRRRHAGGQDWSTMLKAIAHFGSLLRELVKFSTQKEASVSMSQSMRFSMSVAYSQSVITQRDPGQIFALHSSVDRYLVEHGFPTSDQDRSWLGEWTKQYSTSKRGSGGADTDLESVQADGSLARLSPWFIPREQVDFEALNAFNEGAFGSIHQGKWFGTPVIVKRVKQANAEAELRQEADVWFQLNHINVVKMYGACDVGDLFFVCEYASGGDLDKYLRTRGRSPYLIWYCLLNAALGLQYLHDDGIVHADLKANNILVGADDVAKLTDFGLSVRARSNEDGANGSGGALGAYRWKAPECLSGSVATFASDVYSFAMVIIEILSGTFPWGADMSDVAVKHHVKKGVLPPRPSDIADAEWGLIERMCSLDPADRVTMDGVVVHLSSLIQKLDRDELFVDGWASGKTFKNHIQARGGAMLNVIRTANTDNWEIWRFAIDSLTSIDESREGRSDEHEMTAIVNKLFDGWLYEKALAAYAISQLVVKNPSILVSTDIINQLVKQLSANTLSERHYAAEALANMFIVSDITDTVVSANGVGSLLKILCNDWSPAKTVAARSIDHMTRHPSACDALIAAHGIEVLIETARTGNENQQPSALHAIYNIASYTDISDDIISANGVEILLLFLRGDDDKLKFYAVRALVAISSKADINADVMSTGRSVFNCW